MLQAQILYFRPFLRGDFVSDEGKVRTAIIGLCLLGTIPGFGLNYSGNWENSCVSGLTFPYWVNIFCSDSSSHFPSTSLVLLLKVVMCHSLYTFLPFVNRMWVCSDNQNEQRWTHIAWAARSQGGSMSFFEGGRWDSPPCWGISWLSVSFFKLYLKHSVI